ncbi:MAG: TonB-dependent receptor [Bacteroidetes bacterium]|nr:TonB-dependent receptor [Bacteroidota bacterium]
MSKRHSFLFLLLAGSPAIYAQTSKDSTVRQLDLVVVTATKSPKKLSETGKVVTVISREEIDHSSGKDLSQILNEQTGVIVNGSTSNPGKDKTIFLRGASDKYTLILLDGVPLNDPSQTGGQYDIRLIPVAQVERVEILKGSQSTLYGSNAVAGVINIITRKAASEATTGHGTFSYGAYNTLKGSADFERKGKIFDYDLNYQYINTDGISEAKDTTGKAGFPKNGYTLQSFQSSFGVHPTDALTINPYFRYSENKGTFSSGPFAGGNDTYKGSLVNTGLTGNLKYRQGTVYANFGYDYTQRYYGGQYASTYQGRFYHGEAFVNHRLSPAWQLLAGVNFQSYSIVRPDTVNTIISPYASLFYKTGGLNVELGGRFNHDNKYGDNFTYSFNPSYLIHRKVKLFTNITSGFRPPSVNELFGPYGANPALKPERSYTEEGGAQLFLLDDRLTLTGDYFDRMIRNVIFYSTDPVTYQSLYINRDQQHDHGIEGEIRYSPVKGLTLKAAYTYIDGKVTQKLSGKDTTFNNLIRVPKNNFQLYAGYQLTKAFFINTSLQLTGKRQDQYFDPVTYVASNVTLASYALWNAYAEYRLCTDNFKLFVDIKNITNKKNYYEVYGYSVQGINLTVGLSVKL